MTDRDAYAEAYAASHRKAATVDYLAGYADLLLLDRLLPAGYRLLDVGCGTGGYLRHLINASAVVAIDSDATLIAKARAEYALPHVEFRCQDLSAFSDDQPFDAVRLSGTIGWYVPWSGNEWALARAREWLRPGGVLVLSYVPPRRIGQLGRMIFAPQRTVVISERRMTRLAAAAGFGPLITIAHANGVWAFFTRT